MIDYHHLVPLYTYRIVVTYLVGREQWALLNIVHGRIDHIYHFCTIKGPSKNVQKTIV